MCKKVIFIALLIASMYSLASAQVCVDITEVLYQGSTDRSPNGPVLTLQKYLNHLGFLRATPNGYFGPATKVALQKFQQVNGITSTGQTGPLTRSALKKASCLVVQNQNSISKNEIAKIDKITVTSPVASSTLKTDQNILIKWKEIKGSVYDVLLEDRNGVGYGYIVPSFSGDRYEWKVGDVQSFDSKTLVPPGDYRIRLRPSLSSQAEEQVSGVFSISARPILAKFVYPTVVSKSENPAIVVYGSGLDSTSKIYFDYSNDDTVSYPSYVSSDGRALVFSVPNLVQAGNHSVFIVNTYSSGATSTPSSSISLNVIN